MENNDFALLNLIQLLVSGKTIKFPDAIDWKEVMDKSFKQGVGGLVFDALEYVPKNRRPSKAILMSWLGRVVAMERLYENNKSSIAHLATFYQKYDIKMLLLKGYGLSLYWPLSHHRPVGDIDIYLFGKQAYADNIIRKHFEIRIDNSHHKHSVFTFENSMVENHYSFLNVHAHRSTAAIEHILLQELTDTMDSDITNVVFPSVRFNSLYLLRHSAEHFASVDINLRIVLDWAFFVKANPVDWDWLLEKLEQVGMMKYMVVLNAICVKYLGFDKSLFPDIPVELAVVERSMNDILSPEVEKESHDNLMAEVAFRFKRWWKNRWKHDMVFKESQWQSLMTQIWSHLLKPGF